MKLAKLLMALVSVGALMSCEKGSDDAGAGGGAASEFSVAGYAQKGQFIKGSTITAYALDGRLAATGESFPSTIKDDLGFFYIDAYVAAPYLDLRAEGYYFVENTGETSAAPIYLNALVASSQKKVNINLLTTLTSGRIKRLIGEGMPFDAAKRRAEREIISALSLQPAGDTVGFEEMNISEDGDDNALLLAISCQIQEGRTAGEVQKLISDISAEFESDGRLSEKLLGEIFDESRTVSISDVVENLMAYYERNGVKDFKIPPFYTIINKEYAQGFHIVETGFSSMPDIYDTGMEGGTKEFDAVSYEDFVTRSDVDWISAEVTEICSHLYRLKIHIAPNAGVSGREGHVYVESKKGEILYTNTTKQRGNGQVIIVELPEYSTGPRTRGFEEGDKVNINGTDYELMHNPYRNQYFVELPKWESGYGISNMPETVVSGENGDVLCATFTYKPEVDEFVIENDDTTIEWIAGTRTSDAWLSTLRARNTPCYVALKGMRGYELQNPAVARLEPACALLTLEFESGGPSVSTNFGKLKVELGEDGFLSGRVTCCMYPELGLSDPTYIVPKPAYKDKSNAVMVRNTDGDSQASLLVHPQTVTSMKCTAYAADGSVLFESYRDMNLDLAKGTNLKCRITVE